MPIPSAIRPGGSQLMSATGVEGATVIDNVQDRIDYLDTAKAETSAVLTTEQVQDLVAAMVVAGSNVSAVYDDTAGTLTISSTGGGGGSMTREEIEDLLASSFVAGSGMTVVYSDGGNSFTITNTDGGAAAVTTHNAASDPHGDRAYSVARANHTGTQAATTVTTSGHDGNLSGATTVQAALDIVDNLSIGGGGAPSGAAGGDLAGTYPNPTIAAGVIVDADVNASAAIAQSKIANLTTDLAGKAASSHTHTAANVTDFDTQVRTNRLDQMAAPTASVSANSQKITSLATPTASGDAAPKGYVDGVVGGSVTWGVDGAVTTRTGKARIYNDSGRTRTIISARATADTAPTGASLIVDVNKGGTTIFGTQSARPTIAVSTNTNKSTGHTVTTWADGEYLTVDVDQIGSTVAGSDLTVTVEWR